MLGVFSSFWVVGASSPSELGEPHSTVGLPGASGPAGAGIPLLPTLIPPITLPSAPSSRAEHPADVPDSRSASLPLSLLPRAQLGEPCGFCWGNPWACSWLPIPAILGLHVGEGRFRHLINLDLICK